MTTKDEALAQPEQDGKCKYCTDGCVACSAKSQPEQEPIGWVRILGRNIFFSIGEPVGKPGIKVPVSVWSKA